MRTLPSLFGLAEFSLILAEAHALLLARRGRAAAARVLSEIDSSNTTVVRVSTRDERRAREILADYDDKDFSLTYATSFAVMERLRIAHAFAFDRNLTQYGLSVLTPDLSVAIEKSALMAKKSPR